MSDILLIAINARFSHSNPALYYLRNYVRDCQNISLKIMELSINQFHNESLQLIYQEKPRVALFSVYIWNSEIVKSLIVDLKKVLPEVKIVLGGPEVSFNSEDWLSKYSEIDYLIQGGGEAAFLELIKSDFTIKDRLLNIKNPHFAQIPFPYNSDDLDNLQNHYIYYETTRGCPFRCSYCISSRSEQRVEKRDWQQIENELLFFINSKVKIVKLVDRSFNADKKFCRQIWEFLIKNYRTGLTWHFELYPNLLEDEDFEILKRAPKDYFQLEIGIQSIHDLTLKTINRPETWNKVKPKIEKLISLKNMHIHVDLIAGLPYEDLSLFKESFNAVYQLKADEFQLGFLKVLPGTEIAGRAVEFGIKYSTKPPYNFFSTNWFSYEELLYLEKVEFLLDRYVNTHAYNFTIDKLVAKFETPFAFFAALTDFRLQHYADFAVKDWTKNSEFLILFNQHFKLVSQEFILDTLLADWALNTSAFHRPPFLADHQATDFLAKNMVIVKDLAKKGLLSDEEELICRQNMNLLKIIAPLTQEFRDECFEGADLLIIARDSESEMKKIFVRLNS